MRLYCVLKFEVGSLKDKIYNSKDVPLFMDTIRIVQYEHGERELEQLLALHKSFFERFCRDYQTADYFSDSLQTGSSRTFLAIEGDRVVGFARYGNEYRNPDMEFYRLTSS